MLDTSCEVEEWVGVAGGVIERVLDTSGEVEGWVSVAGGVIEVDSDERRGGVVERVDDGDEREGEVTAFSVEFWERTA